MNPLRDLTRAGWVAVAAVALLVVVLVLFALTEARRSRESANLNRATGVQAQGQAAAGRDAVAVVSGAAKRDDQTDNQTKENRDAILNAPGADVRLDPGLDAATRRAICLRQSSRRDPECVALLDARPR
ncbi:hypothetical protein [Brevundimonas sp. Root1279]|uniref:hypothetical protein n=1 Tax=Brevundimonas sp. Root1279 TaxID=1736443 RepID=UPI0006F6E950|nr:hypothetical protein [Brevundimonas sp. Root1279]KQW79697.1 hypothetical protein ASC65_14205 [Brevundimonas sp. Root1279]